MSSFADKIKSADDLAVIRAQLREEKKRVVQCHGCFDIVHPGHIRYLAFAKEQGDVLIVSVSADRRIDKGVDRPYINENLRLENLAVLEMVDYVCLDDNDWAGPILEQLKPDVYVKGKEYDGGSDPRFAKERALVEETGGTVIFSSGEVVYSSTFILSEFKERFDLEAEKIRVFCERHNVTLKSLVDLQRRMAEQRLLVVGDPIIDRYVHCESIGVASESPVLDVSPLRDERYVGAAGLIAAQAAALGAKVGFMSAVPNTQAGEDFLAALEALGVEPLGPRVEDRPVYEKTRYLVEETKVFKVNVGRYAPLSTAQTGCLIDGLREHGDRFDGWVFSDFGYGLFATEFFEAIENLAALRETPFFFDVSRSGAGKLLTLHGAALVTPTEEELRFAFGDRESGLSNLASRYYASTRAKQVFVTLGKRGVVMFDPPKSAPPHRMPSDYLPSLAPRPVDTVGAGDVFMATAALAKLAKASAAEAAYLGSSLAALHVQRLGNAPVGWRDVQRWLEQRPELRPAGS